MTKKNFWDDYPDEIKKRAIANCKLTPLRVKPNVLEDAFFWDNTPEQYDFWDLVNQGRYYEALELLDEQEAEQKEANPSIEKTIEAVKDVTEAMELADNDAEELRKFFAEYDRMKAENEALKRQSVGIEEQRKMIWAQVAIAVAGADNCVNKESCVTFADHVLKAFDERFSKQDGQTA